MNLTKTERLILWNQYEIRKHLDPKSAEHCEIAQDALKSGYQPVYAQVLDKMEQEVISQDQANFVYNVLDMFDALQRFEQASGKAIDSYFAKFRGFDGHGDLVGFTYFNVVKMGR